MRINSPKRIPLTLFLLLAGGLLGSERVFAVRAPAPQYLYFNAECTDCALAANSSSYGVVARLATDQYAYREPLTNGTFLENGNVISFTYSGSNLAAPFQALAQRAGEKSPLGGIQSISGVINTGVAWPAPTDGMLDVLFGRNERFTIALNGDWAYYADLSTSPLPNDYGHGTWSLTATAVGPDNQQIPEPGTTLLYCSTLPAILFCALRNTWKSKPQSQP